MKIKRYEAPTLQEVLIMVKREMGSDAVILHTKKIPRRGFLGLFNHESVEVFATEKLNNEDKNVPIKTQRRSESPEALSKEIGKIKEEIVEVKDALKLLVRKESEGDEAVPYPPVFGEIYLKLIDKGVENIIAQKIINSLENSLPEGSKENAKIIEQYLKRNLISIIRVSGDIELKEESCKVIALVGPTGVGKTTTAAKIASKFVLDGYKNVGLIAADNYRIAATEQLKTYGDILQIPTKIIYDGNDLKQAIDQFVGMDLVIIDTAGRSPYDKKKVGELQELLSYSMPIDIYLLISATTRYKDITSSIEKFKEISFNNIIFTKLDETTSYGVILNVLANQNLTLSYITNGQDVPGNIEVADSEKIINIILGE